MKDFLQKKQEDSNVRGNNPIELQKAMDSLSAAVFHNGPPPAGLKSAIKRVTGMTKSMMDRGITMSKQCLSSPAEMKKGKACYVKRSPHTSGKRKKRDLGWVYDWFHTSCPLVYPDKTRPCAMKGRKARIVISGELKKVTCVKHCAEGNKVDLAQCLLSSPEYKQWQVKNDGDSIPLSSIQKCICPCISQAKVNQCSCKTCTEFAAVLSAWEKQRTEWHNETPCKCPGCSDNVAFARYRAASKNVSAFRAQVCCSKVKYPHLQLPHQPDVVPFFYRLACCKLSATQPPHVHLCDKCGVDKMLHAHDDCIERTNDKASWMQWVESECDTKDGKAVRKMYRKVEGTRKELLERVFELAPRFLYHMWLHQMTVHQGKLREATFDGTKSILVKSDFAATVELQSEHMATCEFGRSCNLYVALIVHSPEDTHDGTGLPRQAKCDCWRVFSSASPNAMFHQAVTQAICRHYKKKIPTLEFIEFETDGCSAQFKGRFNFFCIGGGRFDQKLYAGVTQQHRFLVPGHGGGTVDNQGKVAKDALSKFGNLNCQNYHDAYVKLANDPKMKKPREDVKGTWACNGELHWGALSNGKDWNKNEHEQVPDFSGDVTSIPGCQMLNAYRHSKAPPGSDARSVCVDVKFLQCYCAKCREHKENECPSADEFGSWKTVEMRYKAAAAKRKTRGQGGVACEVCRGTKSTNVPPPSEHGVAALSKMEMKKVMLLCDGCDKGYHLGCMSRSTIPKVKSWFCVECAQPCTKCAKGDVFDDPLKRLLQCSQCHSACHMHCMDIPLKVEPTMSWTCRDCACLRPYTRRAARQQFCAACNGPCEDTPTAQCFLCMSLWHIKSPCLRKHERPEKQQGSTWYCPECQFDKLRC